MFANRRRCKNTVARLYGADRLIALDKALIISLDKMCFRFRNLEPHSRYKTNSLLTTSFGHGLVGLPLLRRKKISFLVSMLVCMSSI